jgi:hypothetical protein
VPAAIFCTHEFGLHPVIPLNCPAEIAGGLAITNPLPLAVSPAAGVLGRTGQRRSTRK